MTKEIIETLKQTKAVCDRLITLVSGAEKIKDGSAMKETYLDMTCEELEHLQKFTLGITAMLASNERLNEDEDGGSAFFAGELDHKKKEEDK